jgi:hypothetical protein
VSLLGFLAGFSERFVIGILDEVAGTIQSPAGHTYRLTLLND